MKSIEKLREYTLCDKGEELTAYLSSKGIADEIEAEIERDYMKLPVDADGEPIHVGDVLDPPKGSEEYGRLMVAELTYDGEDWYFKGEIPASFTGQAGYFNVIGFTHAKPRTLEDVLTEMLDRNTDGVGLREFNRDFGAFVAHYADEIRDLLGGDAS